MFGYSHNVVPIIPFNLTEHVSCIPSVSPHKKDAITTSRLDLCGYRPQGKPSSK